ncbi:MAG TPA: HAMP domain-containing sensor histidine kinase, partial [Longimicrobium sp.]|nr:HAMP domain-containing sensor histidine kinase [Longimicrobium sp.]
GARGRRPPARGARWAARAATLLALAALCVLVAVPFTMQRRLSELRATAARADAARTLATQAQFALVRQMTALQGAVLAADPAHRAQYRQARAQERETFAALDTELRVLSPRTRAAHAVLKARVAEWHGRVNDDAILRRDADAARALRGSDLFRFEAALRTARDLDVAIAAEARELRDQIARADERANGLAAGMMVAAALVAAVLGWHALRMRRLARMAAEGRDEADRALAAARQEAESRERLMRSVTHDLKNPIGAADGYVELLRLEGDERFTPEQREMLDGIRHCHTTALATIEDLLDLARAEAGELPLALELTDCRAVVREVADEYQGKVRAAGHTLDVVLPGAALAVTTDVRRVGRIIENLVSNAVKYTPAPGRVLVRAALRDTGPLDARSPGRRVEIRVSDSGHGVPPEEREHIFAEFARLDAGAAGGHGVGLATSRTFARMLGGDITVDADAELGGAAFSLWLPAAGQ